MYMGKGWVAEAKNIDTENTIITYTTPEKHSMCLFLGRQIHVCDSEDKHGQGWV